MFVVPALQEAVEKASEGWPVYLYQTDYFNRKYYPDTILVKGAYHGIELPALFDIRYVPFLIEEYSAEDIAFERALLQAIVNFVKNGYVGELLLQRS